MWYKQDGQSVKNISESFLLINKLTRNNLGQYQCLSSNDKHQSSIDFPIVESDLRSQKFPSDKTSHLQIEFLSSLNQLKVGGNILINCSSSDQTPVQWFPTKSIAGVVYNRSILQIPKFSKRHFDYYYCRNGNTQKILSLSPHIFQLFNAPKEDLNKYNTSLIEIIKGKYVGDNITLICRIGRGNIDECNQRVRFSSNISSLQM